MKKKEPGFTLIEMMIALALTVTILGIASSMFITGNKVFSDSDVKTTLQIEGQAIQEKISDIGMQAIGTENTTEFGRLIKSYNKEGEERYFGINQEGQDLSIIEYKKDSGELQFQNRQLISEHISSFTTRYYDTFIEFNINLSLKKGVSDVSHSINFKVAFRNKNN